MHGLVVVEQLTSFVGRLFRLVMELIVATAVIAGAVFVGHELREWREWYWALPPAFEVAPPAAEVSEP